MGKKLIITEKPGVAQDIARALGKMKKKKEYWRMRLYCYMGSWTLSDFS